MIVSQLLKSKGYQVYTVSEETNINEISRILSEKRIGVAVIINKSRNVIGIISERDIIRGLSKYGEKVLDMPSKALVLEIARPKAGDASRFPTPLV